MSVSLPLDEMTVLEKLQLMEMIWDDLSRNAEAMEAPAWHGELLAAREAAIVHGKETFEDWDVAKERLEQDLE